MLIPIHGKKPIVHNSAFLAPGCHLIGDVKIGIDTSVWFNAVLRGDEDVITIGDRCSIQDNTTIHLYEGSPVIIEDEVTVGHNVVLHGCTIKKRSLIGMGSTILDGAVIGEECIIGANTLISSGKIIPPRSLVIGSPGKVVRELNDKDSDLLQISIDSYVDKARIYKQAIKEVHQ